YHHQQPANDYPPLIQRHKDGAPMRLKEVAQVSEAVHDRNNSGFYNTDRAVFLFDNRQPGSNIIANVEQKKPQLPALQALLPASESLND
ncbi:efflux RND transporter permease subunit, partial [Pseudomonas syringae pv. tagetis]|uniref:efflux RND transporter permease subunit n=1 Tax=Pseudomonas syringae group genomosp. 7 TaxID=251699 RepID=UPI00376FE7F4